MPRRSSSLDPDADWTRAERRVLDRLTRPDKVQAWLDATTYNDEETCRSPRRVLRDRKAHCMEGALFACAALARMGYPPLLVDLEAVRDDDHVLAVFRGPGGWGALGKSNFSGLRYRAPVYRSLRELAMSYFNDYYNTRGERTLRTYSQTYRIRESTWPGWRTAEHDLDAIGERLCGLRHYPIVSEKTARSLPPADARLVAAGLLGSNPKGLYKV